MSLFFFKAHYTIYNLSLTIFKPARMYRTRSNSVSIAPSRFTGTAKYFLVPFIAQKTLIWSLHSPTFALPCSEDNPEQCIPTISISQNLLILNSEFWMRHGSSSAKHYQSSWNNFIRLSDNSSNKRLMSYLHYSLNGCQQQTQTSPVFNKYSFQTISQLLGTFCTQ